MIYSQEDELSIASNIWALQSPYDFVMYTYPWGKAGTPLAHRDGPTAWQIDVLNEIAAGQHTNALKRLSVVSGRGVGKSTLMSWLAHWFVSTRVGASVVISANREDQLRKIAWAELRKWFSLGINSHWFDIVALSIKPQKWIAEIVTRDLKISDGYWGIEARNWNEENPDSFAGTHNPFGMMLIFDEASGIPESIWRVSEGFFTDDGKNRYWLALGNGRRNRGRFYEIHEGAHSKRWITKQVNSMEVNGVDSSFCEELIDDHGWDSDLVRVEVRGLFPLSDEYTLISEKDIGRMVSPEKSSNVIIGVDPARTGSDITGIAVRQGRKLIAIERFRERDLIANAHRVLAISKRHCADTIIVDEGGIGAGLLDYLKKKSDAYVRGCNFGWRSWRKGYKNLRAMCWGEMRDWAQGCESFTSIPLSGDLIEQMGAPKFSYDDRSRLQLEKKSEIRKRIGMSPDLADALALTFSMAEYEANTEVVTDPMPIDGELIPNVLALDHLGRDVTWLI